MCREPGLNHYGEIGIASSDHESFAVRARRCTPGGRLAAVSSTVRANEFFALPVMVIRRRAALPPPLRPSPVRSVSARPWFWPPPDRRAFIDVQVQGVAVPVR
jgi:hypothetical protein